MRGFAGEAICFFLAKSGSFEVSELSVSASSPFNLEEKRQNASWHHQLLVCLHTMESSGKKRSSASQRPEVQRILEMAQRISGEKKKKILAINNPHAALRSEIHEEGLHWAIFILRLLLLG